MSTVTLTPEVEAEEPPASIIARILRLIARRENWPDVSGAKPLRGDLNGR